MSKFHINRETHVISRCNAQQGNCPFGGDSGTENHFDSIAEAREDYEKSMKTQELASHSKISKKSSKKKNPDENPLMIKSQDPNLTDSYAHTLYDKAEGWDKKAVAFNIVTNPSKYIDPKTRAEFVNNRDVLLNDYAQKEEGLTEENIQKMIPHLNPEKVWGLSWENKKASQPRTLELIAAKAISNLKKEKYAKNDPNNYGHKTLANVVKNPNVSKGTINYIAKNFPVYEKINKFAEMERKDPKVFENLFEDQKHTYDSYKVNGKISFKVNVDRARELGLTPEDIPVFLKNYRDITMLDSKYDSVTHTFSGYKS